MSPDTSPGTKSASKILSLHLLTVMPSHNVNRDEDGRPKTAMFGGQLRGRISSQAKKRALRFAPHFPGGQRAIRTRLLAIETFLDMVDAGAALETSALVALAVNKATGATTDASTEKAADKCIKELKTKLKDDAKLLDSRPLGKALAGRLDLLPAFQAAIGPAQAIVVSTKEIERLANLRAELVAALKKRTAEKTVEDAIRKLNGEGLLSKADIDIDLALFGRMVAANAKENIEAAASISHAITTHAFSVEMDYFTAGEELNSALKGTGAAITSYGFFGSGVYYQHAVLDVAQLLHNLHNNKKLATEALKQLLHGLIHAQPKGKRNAFASDTAAPFALARITTGVPTINLGFAFLDPITSDGQQADLMLASIERLSEFDRTVHGAYNIDGESKAFIAYPPARKRGTNTPPPSESWTYAEFEAFVLGVLA
jgi:CRISPR system Cascade subunit CasC